MTRAEAAKADLIRYLIRRGIVMVQKTEYENGQPVRRYWWPVRYEKRGFYHYLGGKRVARNVVLDANRHGLVCA